MNCPSGAAERRELVLINKTFFRIISPENLGMSPSFHQFWGFFRQCQVLCPVLCQVFFCTAVRTHLDPGCPAMVPPGLRTAAFIAWTTFIRRRWASDGEKLLERSIKTLPMSISMILNPMGNIWKYPIWSIHVHTISHSHFLNIFIKCHESLVRFQ